MSLLPQNAHLIFYGGAFDPPHLAHAKLVEIAKKYFPNAFILVVPTYVPPQFAGTQKVPKAPFEDRFAMSKLNFDGNNILILDTEKYLPQPSYSLRTLLELMKQYHPQRLSFLVGDDQLNGLAKWYQAEKLVKIIDFLVVLRQNKSEAELKAKLPTLVPNLSPKIEILSQPVSEATSTAIRMDQDKHTHWLKPWVAHYIREKHLYES